MPLLVFYGKLMKFIGKIYKKTARHEQRNIVRCREGLKMGQESDYENQ